MRNPLLGSPLEVDDQKLPYWVWGITHCCIQPDWKSSIGAASSPFAVGPTIGAGSWAALETWNFEHREARRGDRLFQPPPGY